MSENMSNIVNTYKRTANPMYNLLVVLIISHIRPINNYVFLTDNRGLAK